MVMVFQVNSINQRLYIDLESRNVKTAFESMLKEAEIQKKKSELTWYSNATFFYFILTKQAHLHQVFFMKLKFYSMVVGRCNIKARAKSVADWTLFAATVLCMAEHVLKNTELICKRTNMERMNMSRECAVSAVSSLSYISVCLSRSTPPQTHTQG